MIMSPQKTNFKIKVVMFIHDDSKQVSCQISEKIKYITFKNVAQFAKYKRKFYNMVKSHGWNHHNQSANQMIKGNLEMTPFFILEN